MSSGAEHAMHDLPIEVEFDLTEELVARGQHAIARTPRWSASLVDVRKKALGNSLLWGIISGLAVVGSFAILIWFGNPGLVPAHNPWIPIGIAVAVAAVVFHRFARHWLTLRRARTESVKAPGVRPLGLLGPVRLQVDLDGMLYDHAHARVLFRWPAFEWVGSDDSVLVFASYGGRLVIVPRTAIGDAKAAERLLGWVQHLEEQAGGERTMIERHVEHFGFRCSACTYETGAVRTATCPECGRAFGIDDLNHAATERFRAAAERNAD